MKRVLLVCLLSVLTLSCGHVTQEAYRMQVSPLPTGQDPPPQRVEEPKQEGEGIKQDLIYERIPLVEKPLERGERAGRLSLHFEDISLQELLNEVFYKILGLSYTAPTDLTQRVSIHIDKVSKEEAFEQVKSLLELAGYGVFHDGRVLKVVPQKAQLTKVLPAYFVYKPSYLSPQVLNDAIKGLLSPIGKAFISGQSLVVIDEKSNVERIRNLVVGIDGDAFKLTNIAFLKTTLPADQVKESIEKILRLLGKADAPQVVEALKREGILLVVSSDKVLFEEIKGWVRIIEEYSKREAQEVAIYKLNFINAKNAAEIISNLGVLQETLTIATEGKAQSISPQPEQRKEKPQDTTGQQKQLEQPPPAQPQQVQPQQTPEEKKEEKVATYGNIIADTTSNSLIVKATPLQHQVIRALLSELDRVPKQVLIEMAVAEVSLGDSLQYGFEGLLKGFIDSKMFNISTSFGLIPNADALQGLKVAIFSDAKDLRAILNLLSSKTSLRVLSAPHIIVRDNEEATIQVGAEVPVLTQQLTVSTGGTPSVQNQVQYRTTGIILRVVPTISTDGRVSLKIYQEVSDAVPNTITPQLTSPVITKRSTSTTLIVDGSQIALLSGIIQSRTTKDVSGVPLLSDIPGLGVLFKNHKETTSNTELIVLIKANVINIPSENTAYKAEFLEKTKRIKELIKVE
ncbi:MAG: general secretion pathway protein GspD [Acidobacteria bacterium]|jgi:general secretion pathway protein D|nr:MAG: general secretion pathway protein GspD [Acidobacteriota bacterium]